MLAAVLLAFQTYPTRYVLPTPPPCSAPFHDTAILQRINPEVPPDVTFDHPIEGAAQVDIAPDGTVMRVRMTRSTGNPQLDDAIMQAARKSTYQARQDNCNAVPGTFTFQADFESPEVLMPATAASAAPVNTCNHEGRVATSAHVVYPASLRVPQTTTALVKITIGTDGALLTEAIAQSTGNDTLDQSALDAARHSIYSPKLVGCKPVVTAYIFRVVFQPH